MSPNLERPEYAPSPATATLPLREATLMIRPCPCLSITGMISRMNRKGARRLTARSRLKTASSRSKLPGMLMPAPLKSRSTRPCRRQWPRRRDARSRRPGPRPQCPAGPPRPGSVARPAPRGPLPGFPGCAPQAPAGIPSPRARGPRPCLFPGSLRSPRLQEFLSYPPPRCCMLKFFAPRPRPSSELILFRTARARHRQRLF